MTIKDIASKLGVSVATVSLCLRHRESDPRYCIRAEKAERIRNFARSHGYVLNATASRLRSSGELPPVGIIFNEMYGFERRMAAFHSIVSILTSAGRTYQVLSYRANQLANALEFLRAQRCCEVICLSQLVEPCPVNRPFALKCDDVASRHQVDEYLNEWRRVRELLQEMTLYALYYQFPRPVDGGIQRGLVRMGADLHHFMENTLRRIVKSDKGPVVIGRWSSMEERLIPELIPSSDYIIENPPRDENRFEAGIKLGKELLEFRKSHPFNTVFYGNDMIAGGIMTAFVDAGLRIPEDVGVLGFGCDDAAPCLRVPLSTFNSGIETNAVIAANAIVEKKQLPWDVFTDFSLIQRKSFVF